MNGANWVLTWITYEAVGLGATGDFYTFPGDGEIAICGTLGRIGSIGDATIEVVPEPGTVALVAFGLGVLAFAGRRR